jgi:uncharacterized protein (TIGR03086 family)
MTAKELYLYAVDQATAVIVQVEPDQLELPTPDTEWNVHDLLQHMTYELAWAADIVSGRTMAEVGDKYEGDLLDDDPIKNWRRYDALTQAAVEMCDERTTAHLSYGDELVREYLEEAANDQLVHAWDLGQAIGISVVFDPAAASVLYARAAAIQPGSTGGDLFGPPVKVPDSANIQTKLLALLGRSEDWVEARNNG